MNMEEFPNNNEFSIPPVVALHRYFIWANKMRTDFDILLNIDKPGIKIEQDLYMSYWYGGLYVVIEGWDKLDLNDTVIDGLLAKKEYVELLRRYRNGVFHFQKTYFDRRFVNILEQGKDFVTWVRKLNGEFGRYFLQWHAKQNNTQTKQ
jgi:hypothetical protein